MRPVRGVKGRYMSAPCYLDEGQCNPLMAGRLRLCALCNVDVISEMPRGVRRAVRLVVLASASAEEAASNDLDMLCVIKLLSFW